MSTHFCKVGRIIPNLNKSFNLKTIKEKTIQSLEVVRNKNTAKGFDVAS
ncbi:hypothetical protein [Lacinutrix jangbogonensis]|nr:hypothetical protein [Lacinutrix jangbogonensis]